MKTHATKQKRAVPAMSRTHHYVHHPIGPVQRAQQATMRKILRPDVEQTKADINEHDGNYALDAEHAVADLPVATISNIPPYSSGDVPPVQKSETEDEIQPLPEEEEEEEQVQAKLIQRKAENEEDEEPVQAKMIQQKMADMGKTQASRFGSVGQEVKSQYANIRAILHSSGAQAKLTIGQPNDKYEQEADRIADQVMAMPDPKLQRQPENEEDEETLQARPLAHQITPLVQRQEENPDEEAEPVQAKFKDGGMLNRMCPERKEEHSLQRQPEGEEEEIQAKEQPAHTPQASPNIAANIRSLKGGGQPLDESTQSFFEPRFGYDFSQVRIHTNAQASDTARSINAKAFTHGKDLVFGAGEYRSGSTEGKRLIAHELTHVLQQTSTPSRGHSLSTDSSLQRIPKNPEDTPFDAVVNHPYSVHIHAGPGENTKVLADLRHGHPVTILGGQAWIHVKTEYEGQAMEGYISHELLDKVASPQKEEPTPDKDAGLRTLTAIVSESSAFFVRAAPINGEKLGKLALEPMKVKVVGKHGTSVVTSENEENAVWLEVEFSEGDFKTIVNNYSMDLAMQLFQSPESEEFQQSQESHFKALEKHTGTRGWLRIDAFGPIAMPWEYFLELLWNFELEHLDEPLTDRLTRLRKMGEDKGLHGDWILGYGGHVEQAVRDERSVDPSNWGLLFASKAVEMPNGEIIDIHHFLLSLEILQPQARIENRKTLLGPIGENFSVASWSGDVGGAVVDFVDSKSKTWEEKQFFMNEEQSEEQRLKFYFRERAPDSDLLADIDAWGAIGAWGNDEAYTRFFMTQGSSSSERSGALGDEALGIDFETEEGSPQLRSAPSIAEFLITQYGGPHATAREHKATVKSVRSQGIKNFLNHYGFFSTQDLSSQTIGFNSVLEQVMLFSKAWYEAKRIQEWDIPILGPNLDPDTEAEIEEVSEKMTVIFLDWLEKLSKSINVNLDEP